MKQTPY